MPLLQPKQISKLIEGRVYVGNYPFVAGAGVSTFDATIPLSGALISAGDNGVNVPLQQFIAATQPGLVTSGNNIVEIYVSSTKLKMSDASGNEVYGRLTWAMGAYTVSLYSLIGGVETPYVVPGNITIDFVPSYVFTFETLPASFATRMKTSYVSDDPATSGQRVFVQPLVVTALNTIAAMVHPYVPGKAVIYVNGQAHSDVHGSFTITPGSTALVWNPIPAGFNLEPTDELFIEYTY